MTYTTVSGDLWDMVSFNVYGSEEYTGILMQANLQYVDIVIFDSGVVLRVPELLKNDTGLPPWRSAIDSAGDEEFDTGDGEG